MIDTIIDSGIIQRFNGMIERIKSYNPSMDEAGIRYAFEVASLAHNGQSRKSGDPFLIHPLAVAEILCEMEFDSDSIIVALLHDTIEDTPMSYGDISRQFGKEVADMVDGLTKLNNLPFSSKEEEKLENLRKMFFAMTKDIRVIIIKLADRLHNMRTVAFLEEQKRRDMALETMEVYAPIAHRLGIDTIKNELEDLSLKYLDPVAYQEIIDNLDKNSRQRERFIEGVIAHMRERFDAAGMSPYIEGRVKHIYSIYRKMFGQHRGFNEIFDIYAIRVIVDDQTECYNVLGLIHDLYKPIPGRFKDYIGTPKLNMYQSLHTTVIGREGTPFEVQIRTWEMHHINEFGIAAHWKYKDGNIGQSSLDDKLAWIRQTLETQQDSDPEDFFSSLKVDMFADEVFVFTPKGDVIGLPTGATPIDFAYCIHSAIGNQMVGAKVNNRIVPIDSVLQNGDIVEVLTLKSSRGPSRDWLNIAKTSEARNKIRQWFKKERREENIAEGKEMLEREMHRNLIPSDALKDENIGPVLKKLSLPALEDFYASIGYGGITLNRAINRIKDEYAKRSKPTKPVLPIAPPEADRIAAKFVKSKTGVIVEGLTNCLVKFAKCCEPVPGDPLVGFVTKGYGVSVHRDDCANVGLMQKNPDDDGRWLRVYWAQEVKGTFLVTLQMTAKERVSLLADVAGIMASLKLSVKGFSSRETGDGFVTIQITFETKDTEHLSSTTAKLRGIPGVIEISRKQN